MTPTNLAELPDVVADAYGQHWHKHNNGAEWYQPGPMGAPTHPIPFGVLAKRAPITTVDGTRVLVQKPADDLNAAEKWQDTHEDETGHRTYRCNPSWSGGTGVVKCAGAGITPCRDTFLYRNTRDKETTDA